MELSRSIDFSFCCSTYNFPPNFWSVRSDGVHFSRFFLLVSSLTRGQCSIFCRVKVRILIPCETLNYFCSKKTKTGLSFSFFLFSVSAYFERKKFESRAIRSVRLILLKTQKNFNCFFFSFGIVCSLSIGVSTISNRFSTYLEKKLLFFLSPP